MANVYVFNCYNEPVTQLSVAGYGAGNIPGYGTGSNPNVGRYTPTALPVPRTKSPGTSASFAIGANPVQVPWNSFTGSLTVTVPDPNASPISLDDDLLLMLAVNQAVLLSTRGYVLNTFSVSTSMQGGEPVS